MPEKSNIQIMGELRRRIGPLQVSDWLALIGIAAACASLVATRPSALTYALAGVLLVAAAVGLVILRTAAARRAGESSMGGGVRVHNEARIGKMHARARVQNSEVGAATTDVRVTNRLDADDLGADTATQESSVGGRRVKPATRDSEDARDG